MLDVTFDRIDCIDSAMAASGCEQLALAACIECGLMLSVNSLLLLDEISCYDSCMVDCQGMLKH